MRLVPRVRLFGPVLLYDMVRTARRGRYVLVRCLYAAVLAFVLGMLYLSWYTDRGGDVRVTEMADFAASFFFTFMGVQFAAVALLTPAYAAGAIAEEKERRTLEYLLATDLRNPELVLGKLTSRLAGLGLIVLTGLPVLSLLQLLGGVDPFLVLAGFSATAVTMLSLAGVSILSSVQMRRTRDAIVGTYGAALLYLAFSGLCWLFVTPEGWAAWPSTDDWISPVTVEDVVKWVNAGNTIAGVIRLSEASGKVELHEQVMEILVPYVLFHATVAVGSTAWAVARVRKAALGQSETADRKKVTLRVKRRPPVGRRPVLWKEVYVEGRGRMGWPRFLAVSLLVILSFVPAVWITVYVLVYDRADDGVRNWEEWSWAMNVWARIVGTIVVCLVLLAVAIRAAGSVTGERERQTFDALLTSPLESREILFGKWLGSILGARGGWLWAGAILGVGLLSRGVHVLALPALLVAWGTYAAFAAALGLWFSLYCRTTLRAMVGTVLGLGAFAFGHWLLWMCVLPVALLDVEPAWGGKVAEHVSAFQYAALTPPITLGILAFHGSEFRWDNDVWGVEAYLLMYCAAGVLLYALGASGWYTLARRRFAQLFTRRPLALAANKLEPAASATSGGVYPRRDG